MQRHARSPLTSCDPRRTNLRSPSGCTDPDFAEHPLNKSGADTTGPRQIARKLTAPCAHEALFRSAFDAIDASTALVDASGRIVAVNRAWRAFAARNGGRGSQIRAGANYFAVCDRGARNHPEAAITAISLRQALGGGPDPVPVEYACHSPREQRWFQACIHGFTIGRTRFAVIMHQDVTAIRKATASEAAAAQCELVATIAAGVAHEFNSLLLAASIQLHRHFPVGSGPRHAAAEKVALLLQQAKSLAGALLDLYSGPEERDPGPLPLRSWLPATIARLEIALPPGVRVRTRIPAGSPMACAHAFGLEQVVRNLLVNAACAMHERGTIRVSVARVRGAGRGFVEIRISDNGPGIPKSLRHRVFEPGFTTRARSHRSGLGLAIAARLVGQFGGTIGYKPNRPRGSSFMIRLREVRGDTQ